MLFLRDKFLDSYRTGSLAWRLRSRRFELFRQWLARYPRPLHILDVGGTMSFWKSLGVEQLDGIRITLLNLEALPTDSPVFTSIAGDAADLSRFRDWEFDIVFSNSVIEHVGDNARQEKMAREIRRVGKSYFVQTPNLFFPIEAHFYFPFFQFMPVTLRALLLYYFDLTGDGIHRTAAAWKARLRFRRFERHPAASWARCVERVKSVRLMGGGRFRRLFPGGVLHREKFLGLTKSFIVYSGPEIHMKANTLTLPRKDVGRAERRPRTVGAGSH